MQLAEHHDVGGHFRAGVFLEGRVGQTDCAQQFNFAGECFTQGRIQFIERVPGSDKQQQTTRTNLVQRSGEKIIVNGKLEIIPTRVMDGVIAKRHIGNGEVISAVR